MATARMHTNDLLREWCLLHVAEDAELIVSEIVTNAIKATNIIPPQARYPELYDRLEVICLSLYQYAGELLIEVWDPRREEPEITPHTLDEEGGRGLQIVASLATRWGTRWPITGGKVVWASLTIDSYPSKAGDSR
ncbi:ATP-binding protein [Spongiactinospora sp. 9N601]|uniref:ATP-binding protein n=1 Tax=Spongiactinospora sp. 9N601 TaxID=3375149 RepID=UPI00378E28EB